MKQIVLEKLDWRALTQKLSEHANTNLGRQRCSNLNPSYTKEEVLSRWALVEPLRQLVEAGYRPPIDEVEELDPILKAVERGQLLTREELRAILRLLQAIRQTGVFCDNFASKCHTLALFQKSTYALPNLARSIEQMIDEEGNIKDDASPALMELRRNKSALRRRIEQKIKSLLKDADVEKYLQDDFFTIRADRYVIPMRLDGRGRIKGSIYDTSDSGQTLFIEPTSIAPLNEELLEVELSEKIEILRIFRTLGQQIADEIAIIKDNYEQLVELDTLTAEACFANQLNAGIVELVDSPIICLKDARHPLVSSPEGQPVLPNTVEMKPSQSVLIVSGPNAGGKTVVLKTVGMMHLMAKARLLVPAGPESKLFLYRDIYLELGDAQSLSANLSTFSGHILGLKPILEHANSNDLVLLDEIAAGTEPQAGSALAQAILEELANRSCHTVVTTHFDRLKALAISDPRFRNGSMEYAIEDYRPTYKLILDIPGQSYGIEVAEHTGLNRQVIERAKALRGVHEQQLDKVVAELNSTRSELIKEREDLEKQRLQLEASKAHWQNEHQNLKSARQKAAAKLTQQYEELIQSMRQDFEDTVNSMKEQIRKLEAQQELSRQDRQRHEALRHTAQKQISEVSQKISELNALAEPTPQQGEKVEANQLKLNDLVYIVSLGREGQITKLPKSGDSSLEVQVGLMSTRVDVADIRRLKRTRQKKTTRTKKNRPTSMQNESEIGLTLQTKTNTADLRGHDVDDALEMAWRFIDQALLRGEARIILIHGHGTNTLKARIRDALANNCPYHIRFRPGEPDEGGDGVTVVALDQ